MKLRKTIAGLAAAAIAVSATAVSASAAEITWEGGADPNTGAIAFIPTDELEVGTEYTLTFTINSTVDAPFTGEGACVWVRWAKSSHNDAYPVDSDELGRNYVDLTSDILPAGVQGIVAGANEASVSFVYGEENGYMTEADYAEAAIIAISMGGGIGDYTLADIVLESADGTVIASSVSAEGADDAAEAEVEEEAAVEEEAVVEETTAAAAPVNAGGAKDGIDEKAEGDKPTDTGIADVAVIAGIAVVAAGVAVAASRKRK